jgi:hypothetical protein
VNNNDIGGKRSILYATGTAGETQSVGVQNSVGGNANESPKCKRNSKLKARNIRKKRQRQAVLKSLPNETARLGSLNNTELQSGAGDANEP